MNETMMDQTTPNKRNRRPSYDSTQDTKIQKDPVPQTPTTHNMNWYRISFSCRHTGRYVASTKRRITWRFGSVTKAKTGIDQFEEHEVALVWSVKSGKSRLFWNGQDISRLFLETRKQKPPPNCLEFAWQTSKGVNFKAVARVNPPGTMKQYQFLIGDESLFELPPKDAAVGKTVDEAEREPSPECLSTGSSHRSRVERTVSGDFTGSCGELSGDGLADPTTQTRLASAGFSYKFDMEDELKSDLYSDTLDVLRDVVSSFVPETEEMMSRAIINAFSEDHDSDTSGDSLSIQSDVRHLDPSEVEADVLGDTFEWLKWSQDFISAFDMHDRKLEYMQKHVQQMVAHVRHDRLAPTPASRIMHRVAAVLKLEVTREPHVDTVMFENLNSLTTTEDVVDAMHKYGDITEAAVSRKHEGFGFCRFANAHDVGQVCMAAMKGDVAINGRNPLVFGLFDSPYSNDVEEKITESRDKEYEYDCYDEVEGYTNDHIDPSDECIEATYNSSSRGSMTMSSLRPPTFTQNSFESSTSSYIHFRNSFRNSSSGTMASLSSMEDTNRNPVPMTVVDYR